MKRALLPLLFFWVTTAQAQEATPEDMGVPQAQQQQAAPAQASQPVAVAPPPAKKEEEDPNKFGPAAWISAGYEYAKVWGVPVNAGRLRMGAGGQDDDSAHMFLMSLMFAETDNGRRAWDVRAGYVGDFHVASILRLGFSIEFGYLVIHRATLDSRQWALGIGAGGHVGFDAIRWGERNRQALTIDGRFEGNIYFGGAVLWGPSILLGIRF